MLLAVKKKPNAEGVPMVMRLIFLTLIFYCIALNPLKAQYYKNGLGVQINITTLNESYSDAYGTVSSKKSFPIPGLAYKAAFGFELTRNVTLSLASYPFLGFTYNTQTGGYFGAEVPLLGEFFFGDVDWFGGFIGAGGTFSYAAITNYGSGVVIGPQLEGGVQFPFGSRVVAVKLAYTHGLNKPNVKLFPNRQYTKSQRGMFSFALIYVFE